MRYRLMYNLLKPHLSAHSPSDHQAHIAALEDHMGKDHCRGIFCHIAEQQSVVADTERPTYKYTNVLSSYCDFAAHI